MLHFPRSMKKMEISNRKKMPEVESPNIVQSFVGRNPCI